MSFLSFLRSLFGNGQAEALADQRRKMKNGLRVAFNCAGMLSKVLEVPAMGPDLGSDGESVVVSFPTVSFVVRPYDEVMIVTIQGQTMSTVFHTPNGNLASQDQIMMIGLLGLSQRDNPTLDNNASLTGVVETSTVVAA